MYFHTLIGYDENYTGSNRNQANRSARQPSRSEALTLRSVWAVLWAFVTSLPVVVNMACFFANDWGIYTLLTEGPNFLSTVMKEDIAAVRRIYRLTHRVGDCVELTFILAITLSARFCMG